MSTQLATPEDFLYFDLLAPHRWPTHSPDKLALYRELVHTGEIQIETLLENALCSASNGMYTRVALDRCDHSDGSEAKKAVSQFRNNNVDRGLWMNSCRITNLKNKTGLIRAVILSKQTGKFHFFAIPHCAYKNLTIVEIVMDTSVGYKEPMGIPKGKWCRYEVESFEYLAQVTNEEQLYKHFY
jgi:hypothetical protein